MTGTDVSQFQQKLADRGWSLTVDGNFGPETERVVIAFQQEKGLLADGVVGADTWYAIWHADVTGEPAPPPSHPDWPGRYLREGDSGDDVRTFQAQLASRDWGVDVDGDFGQQTYVAVVQFQQEKGLTVDGIVGPSTWNSFWTAPLS
jgi:peptidoglycan hydrolase-like protein with peptidoglycan-binding domain